MFQWRAALKDALRLVGYDIVRYPLLRHLREHHVAVVFDVGANAGQYGRALRRLGYRGRLVSFEPHGDAFAQLQAAAAGDPGWTAVNAALGERAGEATLHRSGLSPSSSLLPMLARHEEAVPETRYVSTETVAVHRLDDVFDDHVRPGEAVFLKIDTQGYERAVLDGATEALPRIAGIQLELSVVPLYEGSALLPELVDRLLRAGFGLMAVDPGFRDPVTQELLQVDGLFFRPAPADRDG